MEHVTNDGSRPHDDTLRRRTWRLYAWGSRAHWVSTLFATRADVAVTMGALAVIGGVTAAAINDAATRPDRLAGAMTALPQRVSESATAFGLIGRDDAGRRGIFDLVVLDKRFEWVRGSTDELVKDGSVLSAAEVRAEVLGEALRGRLADAKEVIAIGAASSEGDIVAEVHRAGLRARQTAAWVAEAMGTAAPIYTLNLGQYRHPCQECETRDTSWQRPFIVVAVRDKEPGTDIGQALSAAMRGRATLPSLSAYSSFGLARYR